MHLVILNEGDVSCQFMIGGKGEDLVNEMFPMFIRRVRLTGKHHCTGRHGLRSSFLIRSMSWKEATLVCIR